MRHNGKDILNDQTKAFEHDQRFTVIDLFSGIGGFSLGAARAGFQLLAAVDNEPRASKAFAVNFHGCKQLHEDIVQLTGARLRNLAGIEKRTVHGVIGGPPCQGFSRIGRRAPSDPRNFLFDHFFRLVGEIRPWFYVAENVQGILDAPFKSLVAKAISRLKGYRHLPPLILKSSDFGAPTSRQRVLFIGYKPQYFNDLMTTDFSPPAHIKNVTVEMALQGLRRKIDPAWQKEPEGWRRLTKRNRGLFWDRIYGEVPHGIGDPHSLKRLNTEGRVSGCLGTNHTKKIIKRFTSLKEGFVDGPSRAVRLERKGFCPTLRAGTGPERGSFQALRPIHPTEPRVITPREAARLQGFPDWFLFDATKWHSFRQIGNSVSPILAEQIMRVIADHVNGGKP
jgi:DNA (cytosine-5)-methyltransferase 1